MTQTQHIILDKVLQLIPNNSAIRMEQKKIKTNEKELQSSTCQKVEKPDKEEPILHSEIFQSLNCFAYSGGFTEDLINSKS